jgi:hypothetical protein
VLLALLLTVLIYPQYSDYTAAAQSSYWFNMALSAGWQVEAEAVKRGTVRGVGITLAKDELPHIRVLEIGPSGQLLMQGGSDGQIILLIPRLVDGRVSWRCIGGSRKAVSLACE